MMIKDKYFKDEAAAGERLLILGVPPEWWGQFISRVPDGRFIIDREAVNEQARTKGFYDAPPRRRK